MIVITILDDVSLRMETAEIPRDFAPAFRSAVNEIRNELGERLAGMHRYEKEDATTRAVAAIAPFAAAVNKVIPADDPDYR